MIPNVDLDKLIKTNPAVDADKLKKGIEAVEELRRMGIKGAEYEIAPPFARGALKGQSGLQEGSGAAGALD